MSKFGNRIGLDRVMNTNPYDMTAVLINESTGEFFVVGKAVSVVVDSGNAMVGLGDAIKFRFSIKAEHEPGVAGTIKDIVIIDPPSVAVAVDQALAIDAYKLFGGHQITKAQVDELLAGAAKEEPKPRKPGKVNVDIKRGNRGNNR